MASNWFQRLGEQIRILIHAGNFAVLQFVYSIAISQGGDPVGDDKNCFILIGKSLDGIGDFLLRLAVQLARGLVKNQYL